METFALGALSGLAVGLALGYFAHFLTLRRTRSDRSLADATEMLDRCIDVTSARVKYVLAYHGRHESRAAIKEDYLDIKRRYRWADPEVVLAGVSEWEDYHTAERSALKDKHLAVQERIKRVDVTSYALLDALAKRRAKARKYRSTVGGT